MPAGILGYAGIGGWRHTAKKIGKREQAKRIQEAKAREALFFRSLQENIKRLDVSIYGDERGPQAQKAHERLDTQAMPIADSCVEAQAICDAIAILRKAQAHIPEDAWDAFVDYLDAISYEMQQPQLRRWALRIAYEGIQRIHPSITDSQTFYQVRVLEVLLLYFIDPKGAIPGSAAGPAHTSV